MDPGVVRTPTGHSPKLTAHARRWLISARRIWRRIARGKAVDNRAGGIRRRALRNAHEGLAAFAGARITDITRRRPRANRWPACRLATPAHQLLMVRFEKDPNRRLRTRCRTANHETIARGPPASTPAESCLGPARLAGETRAGKLAWTVLWAALGASLAAGLAWSGVWPRTRSSESRPLRLSIVHTEGGEVAAPAISPDGGRVAYRARRGDGMPLLWVRDLASGESQSLPGTEDATMPFWSPDSRDLGFFAGAALKRVSAAGGPVRLVADNVGPWTGYGASWGGAGTIAVSRQAGLFRVPQAAVREDLRLPSGDWAHFWPSFLPDGRRFLFTAKLWTRTAEASEQGIYLGSLDSPKIERLLPDLSSAVYASPGYLVFAREGTLSAAPFDLAAGRVTGPPIAIGDR